MCPTFAGESDSTNNPYAFTNGCWTYDDQDKDHKDPHHYQLTDESLTITPTAGKGSNAFHCRNTPEANIAVDMKSSGNPFYGGLLFWAEDGSNCCVFLISWEKKFLLRDTRASAASPPVGSKPAKRYTGADQVNKLRLILNNGVASAYINNHLIKDNFVANENISFSRIGIFATSGSAPLTFLNFRVDDDFWKIIWEYVKANISTLSIILVAFALFVSLTLSAKIRALLNRIFGNGISRRDAYEHLQSHPNRNFRRPDVATPLAKEHAREFLRKPRTGNRGRTALG